MTNEERVKLVFETISKIAGFEIAPKKEFYMVGNGEKVIHKLTENLNLHSKNSDGFFVPSGYNILPIFKGGYQLEEIKEPLINDEAKNFLRQFKFEALEISNYLYMYDKTGLIVNVIHLKTINVSFKGLQKGKMYSGKELGL